MELWATNELPTRHIHSFSLRLLVRIPGMDSAKVLPMTYDIISCQSQSDLRTRVENALRKGAICNGGPFYDPRAEHWCQAVTIYDDGDLTRLKEPDRQAKRR